MNIYLLHFTFGPVQGFISQARKTSDLFAGSRILSELARAAIQKAESFRQNKPAIISPNPTNKSLPNRLVVRIEAVDDDAVRKLGKAIQETVITHWKTIAEESLIDKNQKLGKPYGFDRQIENLLELYWVAVRQKSTGYDSETYLGLISAMSSRKNVRQIDGPTETGRKCSLDGERNALFFKRNHTGKAPAGMETFGNKGPVEIPKSNYSFSPGEALSAVSFVKRTYGLTKTSDFPSTAAIALMHTLNKLNDSPAIKEYKKLFVGDFDEQLFYEHNTTKEYLIRYFPEVFIKSKPAIDVLSDITGKLKEIKTINAELNWPAYYALLVFDGDSMGQWFSGEFLESGSNLAEFQKFFSEKLGAYGKWATAYLHKPYGRTVYAGGDDFMGFINLQHLFPVLRKLRSEFDTQIANLLASATKSGEKFKIQSGKRFTFSAGVVVAHYKDPLSAVLDTARQMEKKAKKYKPPKEFEAADKNAFTLSIRKRSGSDETVTLPWSMIQVEDSTEPLGKLVEFFKKDLSDNFMRRWGQEQLRLDASQHALLHEVLFYTLDRSCQPTADRASIRQTVDQLLAILNADYLMLNSLLNIAEFLARQTRSQPTQTNHEAPEQVSQ